MEEEIDLRRYWEVLKKRWLLIVVLPLVAAIISGVVSFYFLKPVYQASATLIVGQKVSDSSETLTAERMLNYNMLMANQLLARTYETIAKSRTVEQKVLQELELPLTIAELDSLISINQIKNTEVLKISVNNKDPEMAALIANTLVEQFSKTVMQIKKIDSVGILDKAVTPTSPIKPKKKLNVLIAFVIGLMTSVGLVFLLEYMDNTVKTSKDVEDLLGIPVLGLIPVHQTVKKQKKGRFRW
ncbi:MAG: Wzz/FepE/Etk N-terminal domain-containing protein [Desulfitobacteriaceae bacterium]|nr:Wzz/FepE/Etk N-terminal domain-containing protein [Desulfitobacteriaceae bacterium]MDD4346858.1 Wzz/FepE/Etk N-terminal domain-containing protein [Desulfitobacteriaceae bacterium]MDD4402247.1 Wzz/FepE/Etk N-terminal domain-containing protein [Desulfitobacteriaceae bacterium]